MEYHIFDARLAFRTGDGRSVYSLISGGAVQAFAERVGSHRWMWGLEGDRSAEWGVAPSLKQARQDAYRFWVRGR